MEIVKRSWFERICAILFGKKFFSHYAIISKWRNIYYCIWMRNSIKEVEKLVEFANAR